MRDPIVSVNLTAHMGQDSCDSQPNESFNVPIELTGCNNVFDGAMSYRILEGIQNDSMKIILFFRKR